MAEHNKAGLKTIVESNRTAKRKTRRKSQKGRKVRKISRLRKPEDMPLEQWQIALRKQFGQKQDFRLKNMGDEPIFSEFIVTNPQTNGQYRVAIRGQRIGDNYCSCPDFAVNTLAEEMVMVQNKKFQLKQKRKKRQKQHSSSPGMTLFQQAYHSLINLAGHYLARKANPSCRVQMHFLD